MWREKIELHIAGIISEINGKGSSGHQKSADRYLVERNWLHGKARNTWQLNQKADEIKRKRRRNWIADERLEAY
jgi:hypothetical protein